MPSAETSNKAFIDAAAQVIQILAGAVTLQDSNPEHLRLAMQVGDILSHVFETYGISATVVPPVLLSAAMDMLEHLDRTRQCFVSAPMWKNITADDPQVQQHPLKDKARTLFVSRPVPSTSTAGVTKSTPAPGPSRPKPKPALKKKLAKGKVDKGKGKEVVPPPEDVEDVQGRGRTLAIEKRRRDSSSSRPPALPGDRESSSENSSPTAGATTLKKQKVAKVPLPSPAVGLQDDSGATMDAPELVPRCDQCIKLSFICRQGYGAAGAGLKACAWCSRLKLKCSRSKIETAPVPKAAVPLQKISLWKVMLQRPMHPYILCQPIATLSPDSRSSDPAKSSSPPTLDPPRESVVPSLQHSMEVDSEGDAMVNDLRAMTLVMNDNAAPLSKRLSLQHAA
ncbi:uncharacterized protein EDB91DRAFT_1255254 [Suillus paluster]|uniref:uncharacterized protein n=1 Tax=Suillus paluster TaxID=48578 RepID=UPI001B86A2EC|nr:uncharacterized protein EDB91DRAFT_1255254 [Suillus paluster]KAG1724390.1 hypothetical protein EDB91DRAFT_1255254 [Suillus paluster]